MRYDWHIGIIGSILCHAAVLFAFHASLNPPPPHNHGDTAVEVSLVAAPLPQVPALATPEPIAPPAPTPPEPVVELQPEPEVKPPDPIVVQPKPVPPPKPVKRPPPQPVKLSETPAPAPPPVEGAIAPAPVPAASAGDASAPKPGLDSTTNKAAVGIRAEPNYLRSPEPDYPFSARRRHQQGVVLLTVRVTAEGRAADVAVKKSSGFAELDAAAADAVRRWEFHPARIDGRATESEIEVPIRFKLTD